MPAKRSTKLNGILLQSAAGFAGATAVAAEKGRKAADDAVHCDGAELEAGAGFDVVAEAGVALDDDGFVFGVGGHTLVDDLLGLLRALGDGGGVGDRVVGDVFQAVQGDELLADEAVADVFLDEIAVGNAVAVNV